MSKAIERVTVAVARRLARTAGGVLARPRVLALLHRRVLRAWAATEAPLILCYGNINRSAFAAALARARGRTAARSAGFYPEPGRSAPLSTIECAARYGVNLGEHRSACVTSGDLARAPAIFVFDLENLAQHTVTKPTALLRTHLLGSLDDVPRVLIDDPHGRGDEVIEATLARIARAIEHAEGVA